MSRRKKLPPLAPETIAALELHWPDPEQLAPVHEVNARADFRLLALVKEAGKAERHFRIMEAAAKASEIVQLGSFAGKKPARQAAQWAKRTQDALTEVCKVADCVGDTVFPLHLESIKSGLEKPLFPLRIRVWIAWKFCSTKGRPRMTETEMEHLIENQCHGSTTPPRQPRQYIPSAGEVALTVGASDKIAELSARDCTNHLKALGLPYAPAKAGFKRKSI